MRAINDRPKKSRGFFITCNKDIDEGIKVIMNIKTRYTVIGPIEKAPTTGHIHFHAGIYFENTRSFNAIRKMLPEMHLERAEGTVAQLKDYCTKEGSAVYESGIPPHQGQSLSTQELKVMSKGEIVDQVKNPNHALSYIKLKDIIGNNITLRDQSKWGLMRCFYIWGESGVGKTRLAARIIGLDTECNKVFYEGGFWHGMGDAEYCLYDEWRDSQMPASEFIRFIDYNKNLMNVKGGSMVNNFTTIVITSVQDFDNIYRNVDDEPRKQWIRRIKVIHLINENDWETIEIED